MQSRAQATWDWWLSSMKPWTWRNGYWELITLGRPLPEGRPPAQPDPFYIGGCI